MDVKEFARLGGKARAKALGKKKLAEHARLMAAAKRRKRQDAERSQANG